MKHAWLLSLGMFMLAQGAIAGPLEEGWKVSKQADGITVYTRPKTQKVQLAPSPDVRKAYLHVAKFREKISFRMRPFLDAAARLACLTLRGFSMLVSSPSLHPSYDLVVLNLLPAALCFSQC
jgi:hypothetical protein